MTILNYLNFKGTTLPVMFICDKTLKVKDKMQTCKVELGQTQD